MTDFDQREGILLELDQKTLVPNVPQKWEVNDDFYQVSVDTFRTFSIGEKQVREKVKKFKGYVKAEPFRKYLPYSPLPTQLCRTSPFFVIDRRDPEYSKRPHLEDYVLADGPWGRLTMTGPKLSLYDEDVALALFYFIFLTRRDLESKRLGAPPNSYSGKVRPIMGIMGMLGPGRRDYERVKKSLKNLYHSSFGLTKYGKDKSGTLLFRIFDRLYYEEKKGTNEEGMTFLHASLSKSFLELCGGNLGGTFLILEERLRLKRQTSKAIYRFLRSQRPRVLKLHLNTLRDALNMKDELHPKAAKLELTRAIKEMIRAKLLDPASGFRKNNLCFLIKPGARVKDDTDQKQIGQQVSKMIGSLADAKTPQERSNHVNLVRKQARHANRAGEISRATGRPFDEVLKELCDGDPN